MDKTLVELNNEFADAALQARNPKSVHAALRVYKRAFDPNRVSSLLKLEPTEIRERGYVSKLTGRAAEEGCWYFSTQSQGLTGLSQNLEFIIQKIEPGALRILKEEGHRINISCYWLARFDNAEIHLNHALLSQVAALGADLWLDIYTCADE